MAKLLIVDAEVRLRQCLTHLLSEWGHQVLVAESSRAAIGLLSEEEGIDVVFSDYRMAELNELELLGAIRERYPDVVVILMTAYDNVNHAVAMLKPPTASQRELLEGTTLRKLEEEHIRRTIAQTPSLEDAAHALGIGIATLWRKRKRYRIE